MNSQRYSSKTKVCALLALLAMPSVFLTACSDLLKEAQAAQLAEAPKPAEPAAKAAVADIKSPDVPAHLVKCVNRKPAKADGADGKVIALKQNKEEIQACSKKILEWYKSLQAEQKKVAAAIKASSGKPLTP